MSQQNSGDAGLNEFVHYVASCMKQGQSYEQIANNLIDDTTKPEEAKNLKENVTACYAAIYDNARKEAFDLSALPGALVFGLIAALLGAGAWAAIGIGANLEIGFLAWGMGWVIGVAILQGAGNRKGVFLQFVAVFFSIFSIVAGKYFVFLYHFMASIAKEHGAEVAKMVGVFSFRTVMAFIENIPNMASPYDLLWGVLAIATAWSVLEPMGIDVQQLMRPPMGAGEDDESDEDLTAPDNAKLRMLFPDFHPSMNKPSTTLGPFIKIGLFNKRDKDEETGAFKMTRSVAIMDVPLWPLDAHVLMESPSGKQRFLGTVPLDFGSRLGTGIAKAFALVVVFSVFMIGLSLHWFSEEKSTGGEYLARAHQLTKEGQFPQGAEKYAIAALTSKGVAAKEAAHELEVLAGAKLDQLSMKDAAGVLQALIYYEGLTGNLEKRKDFIIKRALEIVEGRKTVDPAGAIKVLKAIRGMAPKPGDIDTVQEKLCRSALKTQPNNREILFGLAGTMLDRGRFKECVATLKPISDKLGDSYGALVYGLALSRLEKNKEAIPYLHAYVDGNMNEFKPAREKYQRYFLKPLQKVLMALELGLDKDFDYEAVKKMDPAAQQAFVMQYTRGKVMHDPKAHEAILRYQDKSMVLSTCYALAAIRTNYGMNLPVAERIKVADKTEKLMKSIEADFGRDFNYRICYARVLKHLERDKEATELMMTLEKENSENCQNLTSIATVWRQFGNEERAKILSKEALGKAKTKEERQHVAALLAATSEDNSDKPKWLNQCNKANPSLALQIKLIEGHKALEEGERDKARRILTELSSSATVPETGAGSFLSYYAIGANALYSLTGELSDMERAFASIDRAEKERENDATLLSLKANLLLARAIYDLSSQQIDFARLGCAPEIDHLYFLCKDISDRTALTNHLKEHNDFKNAVKLYQSLLENKPNDPASYNRLLAIYTFTQNTTALSNLKKLLKSISLNQNSEKKVVKAFIEGTVSERLKQGIPKLVAHYERCLSKISSTDSPITYAVTVSERIDTRYAEQILEQKPDDDSLVNLAETAYAVGGTAAIPSLVDILFARAVSTISSTDSSFSELASKCKRSIRGGALLAMAANTNSGFRETIAKNEDVKKALKLREKLRSVFPWQVMWWEWALLQYIDKEKANEVKNQLLNDKVSCLVCELRERLSPMSGSVAANGYFRRVINDDQAGARVFIRQFRKRGLKLPATPKVSEEKER